MRMIRILPAIMLLAASLAMAQPHPPDPTDPPQGMPSTSHMPQASPMPPEFWDGPDGGPPCDTACPAGMGKERRMLEAVRISRMTEALDLSDEQIAKFFPRLRKMEEAMRALDRQQDQLIDELQKLTEAKAKAAELRAKLDAINKLDDQRLQRMQNERKELDALLNVEQQARLKVFNRRFDDELRGMVRKIRERRMRHVKP